MHRYLQVVENILYSGSADMKVQAHNLNVSNKMDYIVSEVSFLRYNRVSSENL